MDLEGWEILPENGFLEIHDDGGKTLPVDDQAEQEVCQVFLKKMKESEFAVGNTKMDSAIQENGGLNIWKWGLNGIGAICSFGVAAVTLCIIFIGNRQQNQKLCFQICTHDQSIKKVVHPATKLDEAN